MSEYRGRVRVRPAVSAEAAILSALALRSKAHWGYSAEFLAACADELTFSPPQLASGTASVAEVAGSVAGFSLLKGGPPEGELAALFVDPPYIGEGVGRRLLEDALAAARRLGFRRVRLDSDPGAEPFYARFGARRVGESPSGSIPGRVLPRMEFTLEARSPT
ncbi:GNAT family N-acetyltransferase [Solicola gregarius]|uniref:GNAT family N-acetyltransferase n=1 Tax=Solicola gregarius TaxID=2908642 RepID=A0AA46TJ65_9ACTN|nr:GNAT family N-acetyltransferase [Solicola gregarius]UYM06216.1 GNAT family N-acetyltransferase [Solicola gregarius]